MLVQFTTENFLCFKTEATLSMVASKRRSKEKSLDIGSVFDADDDIKLLKTSAIYGANGSGKSSLIKALRFMRKFVIESSRESLAEEPIKVTPFRLSSSHENKASRFQAIFIQNDDLFQYEFSADSIQVHSESLSRKSKNQSRSELLFSRNDGKIEVHKPFPEGKGLQSKTRKNALFISVCANFDGKISNQVIKWFRTVRIISGLTDSGLFDFTARKLEDTTWNTKIKGLLQNFDLGIERLVPGESERSIILSADEQIPSELQPLRDALLRLNTEAPRKISSYHKSYDSKGQREDEIAFDLRRDESEGTKKLVSMSGPLMDVLENSYILVIDEFDARLHSIITRNIINIFNSQTNRNNAQLIVATHDTNLLDHDLLRRDQIWFTEKDYYGAAHLTSLIEFKVRNDASYEKDYIEGKYGAIPIVGDIRRILGGSSKSKETPLESEG